MDHGLAVRCGRCRGRGWLRGFFKRCPRCAGKGYFEPVTAPGGLGTLLAAAEALRSGAATGLLVRAALPWERFPIPDELKGHQGTPDPATWERALRASAVILYEHADGRTTLASGIELSRLGEAFEALRDVAWDRDVEGGTLNVFDRSLKESKFRFTFFRAWRGEWLELTRDEPRPPAPARPPPISGAAQRYITGKFFVGVPTDDPPVPKELAVAKAAVPAKDGDAKAEAVGAAVSPATTKKDGGA